MGEAGPARIFIYDTVDLQDTENVLLVFVKHSEISEEAHQLHQL